MCCPVLEVIQIFLEVTSVFLCHYILNNLRMIRKHLDTTSGMSFMNSTNMVGPMTLPCGTPEITFFHADLSPFITTLCLRSDKKRLHHPSIVPVFHLHQQSLIGARYRMPWRNPGILCLRYDFGPVLVSTYQAIISIVSNMTFH